MDGIGLNHYLILSAMLFSIGAIGVLVRSRRTEHDSRWGASSSVIPGGGLVRFQNV